MPFGEEGGMTRTTWISVLDDGPVSRSSLKRPAVPCQSLKASTWLSLSPTRTSHSALTKNAL
jgi:hypothetical protein